MELDPVVGVGGGLVGARVGWTDAPHSEGSGMSAVLVRRVCFGSSDLGVRSRGLFPTRLRMVVLILSLSGDPKLSSWERVAP